MREEAAPQSFKMVISRPREHLARGQFNSGRMIAPSRSRLCCSRVPPSRPRPPPIRAFLFLSVSPLSIQSARCHPIPLARTCYIPGKRGLARLSIARISFYEGPARPPARSPLSDLFVSRTLSLPSPLPMARSSLSNPRIIPMEIASR